MLVVLDPRGRAAGAHQVGGEGVMPTHSLFCTALGARAQSTSHHTAPGGTEACHRPPARTRPRRLGESGRWPVNEACMQYQPKELGTVSCQVGAWAAARGQSTRTSPHACGSGVRHRGAAWAQAMRTYLASKPTLGNIPSETSISTSATTWTPTYSWEPSATCSCRSCGRFRTSLGDSRGETVPSLPRGGPACVCPGAPLAFAPHAPLTRPLALPVSSPRPKGCIWHGHLRRLPPILRENSKRNLPRARHARLAARARVARSIARRFGGSAEAPARRIEQALTSPIFRTVALAMSGLPRSRPSCLGSPPHHPQAREPSL